MRNTEQRLAFVAMQFLAAIAATDDLHVLVYETDKTMADSNNLLHKGVAGVNARIVGQGQTFSGFGAKYEAVLPALAELPASAIAVVSDGRDVLLNHGGVAADSTAVAEFLHTFEELTNKHPGAIVLSAEAQCCVSALTHFAPGDLFDADGERSGRACYSGHDECRWNGDDKALPWETFMKDMAIKNGAGDREDVYLNAGLMVGRASDLIRVLKAASIGEAEDDQAVLTDFMYKNPEQIVLDYSQELFGNNRETCMFQLDNNHLVHKQTLTSPLFIHTPGGSSTCHVELMAQLGQKVMSKKVKRRLQEYKGATHNYYEPRKCKDESYKLQGSDCVKNWCFADYQCPRGSRRIADKDCYFSWRDCECENADHVLGWRGCKARKTWSSFYSWN